MLYPRFSRGCKAEPGQNPYFPKQVRPERMPGPKLLLEDLGQFAGTYFLANHPNQRCLMWGAASPNADFNSLWLLEALLMVICAKPSA